MGQLTFLCFNSDSISSHNHCSVSPIPSYPSFLSLDFYILYSCLDFPTLFLPQQPFPNNPSPHPFTSTTSSFSHRCFFGTSILHFPFHHFLPSTSLPLPSLTYPFLPPIFHQHLPFLHTPFLSYKPSFLNLFLS